MKIMVLYEISHLPVIGVWGPLSCVRHVVDFAVRSWRRCALLASLCVAGSRVCNRLLFTADQETEYYSNCDWQIQSW